MIVLGGPGPAQMPPKAGPPRPDAGAGPHLALGRHWAGQAGSWPELGREHGPQMSCLLHNRASPGRARSGPAQIPPRPGPTWARSGPEHGPGLGRPSHIWVTLGLCRAMPVPRVQGNTVTWAQPSKERQQFCCYQPCCQVARHCAC